jgi:aspartate/methionine/tyrosine aminotransferase
MAKISYVGHPSGRAPNPPNLSVSHARIQTWKRIGLPASVAPDGAFYAYFSVAHADMNSMESCKRATEEIHIALIPVDDFGKTMHNTLRSNFVLASIPELAEDSAQLKRFAAQETSLYMRPTTQ